MTDTSRVNIFKYHEDRAWGKPKKELPVTVVTGPLGAGKTTTLRHVLNSKRNLRIAVAVNDFAAVNIDSDLIASEKKDAGLVELTNGCICCSKKGDLVDKVWSILKEADLGNVDYLVIETSGVTDPCTVVQALEADFGKMYRIRLDSVVLVLDGDEVVAKVAAGDPPVHPGQMACADVVLLNKADLVPPKELDLAEAGLAKAIPGVQVMRCSFGAVPLTAILEVREEAALVAAGSVSHEFVERKMHVAAVDAKTLRTAKLAAPAGHGHAAHIADERVDSMVFESQVPFRLGAFQDLLGPQFPLNVRRIKGWLFFAEDPVGVQWLFHYSGRRRFECSPDPTPAQGQRTVRLVLIGTDLDVEAVTALLKAACADAGPRPSAVDDAAADAAVVADDDRFEVQGVGEAAAAVAAPLTFRMTACKPLEVTVEELAEKHGVDLDRVNAELLERVNYSTGAPFLTSARSDDGTLWLRFASTGSQRLGDVWPAVDAAADVLMKGVFSHVYACKCGW